MTTEEAKKFGLQLLHGIMERNESYPVYANNVKQAIDALSEESSSSEIPNDLEEAAHNFALHYDNGTCDGIAQDCFKAGAEWQAGKDEKDLADMLTVEYLRGAEWGKQDTKKQMMENAVEGEIQMRYSGCLCAKTTRAINEDKFKLGDKVKVIIVKEDER